MGKDIISAAGAIAGIITYNGNISAARNEKIFGPNEKEVGIEGKIIQRDNSVKYIQDYKEAQQVLAPPSVNPFPGCLRQDDPNHENVIIDTGFSKPVDPSYNLSGPSNGFGNVEKDIVVSGGFGSG